MLSRQSELLREKEIEYNLFKFLFFCEVPTIKNINLERAKHEVNMNRNRVQMDMDILHVYTWQKRRAANLFT